MIDYEGNKFLITSLSRESENSEDVSLKKQVVAFCIDSSSIHTYSVTSSSNKSSHSRSQCPPNPMWGIVNNFELAGEPGCRQAEVSHRPLCGEQQDDGHQHIGPGKPCPLWPFPIDISPSRPHTGPPSTLEIRLWVFAWNGEGGRQTILRPQHVISTTLFEHARKEYYSYMAELKGKGSKTTLHI